MGIVVVDVDSSITDDLPGKPRVSNGRRNQLRLTVMVLERLKCVPTKDDLETVYSGS
jgi:hypothetical protein